MTSLPCIAITPAIVPKTNIHIYYVHFEQESGLRLQSFRTKLVPFCFERIQSAALSLLYGLPCLICTSSYLFSATLW